MHLAYYKDQFGNFGDDLNPWLWDKLLPGMIDGTGPDVLIGMGTLLGHWFLDKISAERFKIVLGAGGGMTTPLPVLDETYRVYAVRGPLTANYLRLPSDAAATDAAMCLRDLWPKHVGVRSGVGFMPHHMTACHWDWSRLCANIGLTYLDPHKPPLETVATINGLQAVIAEAMHGAIVADALRVPWLPVRINPSNYTGKWDDWGATVRVPIHHRPLPELYDPTFAAQYGIRLSSGSTARDAERFAHLLHEYFQTYPACLSEDADLDRAVARFMHGVDRLRADWAAGVFA